MPATKTKTALVVAAVLIFAFGAAVAFIERNARLRSMQGAWEGAMHFHGGPHLRTQRVVLRLSKQNGSWRASIDQIDLGQRNLPATRLKLARGKLHFELASGFSYDGKLSRDPNEITGRWKWPGGKYSQPLSFTHANTPDIVLDSLAAAEYAARPDSELQGFWRGTLKTANVSLRLHLKIADNSRGTFRAELASIDQPPIIPLSATAMAYDNRHVKIWFQGIGAVFDGDLDDSGARLSGKWSQVRTDPVVFERADPAAEKGDPGGTNAQPVALEKKASN